MMQIRLNSGSIKDLALGQALEGDNGSVKGGSHKTISKALQKPTRDNALTEGKGMQLPGNQKAFKNFSAMSVKDDIKVVAPLDNERFGREEEIAAEIKWLKKKQKKAQIKFKLYA